MERKDLLRSPEYWTASIQLLLYNCAEKFMKATGRNRTQLAEHLGVTKGYVSQVLNGDYDHKLSKFVKMALAFGYVPKIEFVPVEEYIQEEDFMRTRKDLYNSNYETAFSIRPTRVDEGGDYGIAVSLDSNNAA